MTLSMSANAELHMLQQQQQAQQLQTQMVNSQLLNSNLIASSVTSSTVPPTPPAGIALGAPPTPTVKSIAKQMNITIPGSSQFTTMGMAAAQKSQSNTPIQMRKQLPNPHMHHAYGASAGACAVACVSAGAGAVGGATSLLPSSSAHLAAAVSQSALIIHKHPPPINTIEALMLDERFLNRFFLYFTAYDRRVLAQVCMKWREILYRTPRFWSGLLPTLQCRELRQASNADRVKLYNSLVRRGFHALCLVGASDEDAVDVVHSFPLASKQIHSLSLRCSSIGDRGLESLLDHLQVSFIIKIINKL